MSEATSSYLNTGTPLGREIDRLRAENKALQWKIERISAKATRYRTALEDIGIYGCGMLNQPAAMNGPEEAWLRARIAQCEQVARAALNGEEG